MKQKYANVIVGLVVALFCLMQPIHAQVSGLEAYRAMSGLNGSDFTDTEKSKLIDQVAKNRVAAQKGEVIKEDQKSTSSEKTQAQKKAELSRIEKSFIQGDFYGKNIIEPIKVSTSNNSTETVLPLNETSVQQFGYSIFRDKQEAGFALTDIPVGPDYVLGPGDKLVIHIWGKLENKIEETLDQSGKISIPKVGDIYLTGIRFGQVEGVIKKELEKYYVNFELSVTIGKLRTFKVFVLGDVENPGAYDVSSLSTAFMALYAAGGPTKMGTLRNIHLKRNDRTVQVIDLYRYLLRGERNQDPKLQALDTIFVPPIGDVVKIEGEVKRNGIYEIQDNTSLFEAVSNLAGGLLHTSYSRRIQLERVGESSKGERRIMQEVTVDAIDAFKSKLKDVSVRNGDVIRVQPILETKYNVVTILGNVLRPNSYQYRSGMTLRGLINAAEGFKEETYLSRVDVYRYVSDNQRKIMALDYSCSENCDFPLEDRDAIRIYSKNEIVGDQYVFIEGPVKKPGKYKLMDNMRISDVVFLAGIGPQADLEKAELFRKTNGEKDQVIAFHPKEIISSQNHVENSFLKDGDKVFLRINSTNIRLKHIVISGQVTYPGTYMAQEDERLSSVLKRAGGYTHQAFLSGAVFKRESIRGVETQGQKKIFDEERKRLIYDQTRLGALNEHSEMVYQQSLAFLKDKIQENSGRIVIGLASLDKFEGSKDDILMEDGDSLFIPETPSSIHVIGGVQFPSSIVYESNKSLDYYVNQVGGYTEFADRGNIQVIKPNGSISSAGAALERGDSIYIPEKIVIQTNWLDLFSKTTQVIFNLATTYQIIQSIKK